MRVRTRAVSLLVLSTMFLGVLHGVAHAQLQPTDPSIEVLAGPASCNGLLPTPGSENTVKTVTGGSLVPGGTAQFLIRYPVADDDGGEGTWVVQDCVLIGTGDNLKDYDVLDKATFKGVSNDQFFEVEFTVQIPADTAVGTSICNIAKTTSTPSAPQASNRKAGPACFVVGGGARVEKHDPEGALLEGAVFRVHDCVSTAVDPALQPIIINPEPDGDGLVTASEGFISFNGPSGSTCLVTEVTPPSGYRLPPEEDRTQLITIPVGTEGATLFVFVNHPVEPGIAVTKTCVPASVRIGDQVTYTITVTNTGSEDLTGLTVIDSLLGDVSADFPSTLAVGANVSREFTRTVTADDPDPLPNEVTASAVGAETGGEVSESDRCESDVLHEPGIEVTKTCTGPANVGDEVSYTITVFNTGDEPLVNIVVIDSLLGDISALFPDTIAVGGSVARTVTRIVQEGDPDLLENIVTASGTGADSQETVTETAACDTAILRPAIDLEKTGPALAHVGDAVTYTLTVTNIGNTPLGNVVISDPLCDAPAVFVGGDTNSDGLLDLTETWTYTCVHVIVAADGAVVENTATVVGEDEIGTPVSATASHVVNVITPLISIEKTSDVPIAAPGQVVTFTLVVTNAGDTPLHDVVVDDPLCGSVEFVDGDTNEDGVLDLDEVWTYTCTAVLFQPVPVGTPVDPVTNTATAQGTDVLGLTVTATSSVTVDPILAEPPQLPPPGPMPPTGTSGMQQLALMGGLLLMTGLVLSGWDRRRFSLAALGIRGGSVSRLVAAQALIQGDGVRARVLRRLARRRAAGAAQPPPRGP